LLDQHDQLLVLTITTHVNIVTLHKIKASIKVIKVLTSCISYSTS